MDKRTKILASTFAAVIGVIFVGKVIFPAWIEPLLTLDERIAERQEELDRLNAVEQEVQQAKYAYRTLAERIGTFDLGRVETDVRDRLNALIDKHKLEEANVSPSRASEDRRTGIKSTTITVSAIGALESAVLFLRDLAELPHLLRLGNVTLYPATSGRRVVEGERMNLRVAIELRVIPQQSMLGRISPESLEQPERVVRHHSRDYAVVWSGKPFSEYVPPVPLVVQAGPDQAVEKGQRVLLQGSVTGGERPYTFQWMPSDGLNDAGNARTLVNTAEPSDTVYTLTATDGLGQTASANVRVTIREPKPPPEPREVTPVVQAPPLPQRWPDGRSMQIVMTLLRTLNGTRLAELMVIDRRSRATNYYREGDPFDGGELVFVHQTGGLVRRSNDYFVYPIGLTLDNDLPVDSATDFPEIQQVAAIIRQGGRLPGTEAGMLPLGTSVEEGVAVPPALQHPPSPAADGPPVADVREQPVPAGQDAEGGQLRPPTAEDRSQKRETARERTTPRRVPRVPPAGAQ